MRDGKHEVSSKIDRDFVFELCKRGKVGVLSTQVTICGESISLAGLKIPSGVEIEWVGALATRNDDRPECHITFNFEPSA